MITPAPTAPEGSVTTLSSYSPSLFPASAAVLCRNNAPLIAFAFALIRRGVGVRVLGRDIHDGMLTLIDSCKCDSLPALAQALLERRDRDISRAKRKGDDRAADAITDKYECLSIFVQNTRGTVSDLRRKIESLFDSRDGLLTLSTIHGAKGLEWPEVFLLDFHELLPSKWAKQDWELAQERNLQFVAVTRAKRDLFFIQSDCWADTIPASH